MIGDTVAGRPDSSTDRSGVSAALLPAVCNLACDGSGKCRERGGLTDGAELARPVPFGVLNPLRRALEEAWSQLLAVSERSAGRRPDQWK